MASIKGRFGMPGMRQECALRCRSGKSGVRMSSELSVMEFGETTKAGNLQIGFPVSPPYHRDLYRSIVIHIYACLSICFYICILICFHIYPSLSIFQDCGRVSAVQDIAAPFGMVVVDHVE